MSNKFTISRIIGLPQFISDKRYLYLSLSLSLSLSPIRFPSNGVQVGSQLRCVSCDSTTLDQVWPLYILCRACIFVFDHVIWYLWSPTQVRMDAHYNVLLSLVLHVFLFFYFLLTKKKKKNHVGSTSLWCCLTSAFFLLILLKRLYVGPSLFCTTSHYQNGNHHKYIYFNYNSYNNPPRDSNWATKLLTICIFSFRIYLIPYDGNNLSSLL